jgi:predicted Fe-Mo cluster-binding NifX family protein
MKMTFAIPLKDDVVCDHFGHAREYCIVGVENRRIISMRNYTSPGHDRGRIPAWLVEFGITHVIANGIGQKAIDILTDHKIEVIWGVPADKPEILVKVYLDSQLVPGINLCDH